MNAVETLKEILARWPKGVSVQVDEAAKHLSGLLTEDFELAELATRPHGEFTIGSRELTRGDETIVFVHDSTSPSLPHRARLIRGDDGRWRLQSFRFQCLSCFGTGMTDGEPCDTCGATGWGLAKDPGTSRGADFQSLRIEAEDEGGKKRRSR